MHRPAAVWKLPGVHCCIATVLSASLVPSSMVVVVVVSDVAVFVVVAITVVAGFVVSVAASVVVVSAAAVAVVAPGGWIGAVTNCGVPMLLPPNISGKADSAVPGNNHAA